MSAYGDGNYGDGTYGEFNEGEYSHGAYGAGVYGYGELDESDDGATGTAFGRNVMYVPAEFIPDDDEAAIALVLALTT